MGDVKEEGQGTQRRELEENTKRMNSKRKHLGSTAQDRVGWRKLVGGLCSFTGGVAVVCNLCF